MRQIIISAAMFVVTMWTFGGLMSLVGVVEDIGRWWLSELRPLYLPCVVIGYGLPIAGWLGSGHINPWDVIGLAGAIWNWFLFKDKGDNDRWKRRIERLSGVVTRVGSRLAVVPAEGGA